MRQVILCLCVLALEIPACTQPAPGARNSKARAIEAAKNAPIATFDGNLPNISLEYFLRYESNGVPIDWTIVTCDEHAINPLLDKQKRMNSARNKGDAPLCVQATVDDVRAQRSAMVVVQVGTMGAGVMGEPKLLFVMAQDENGASHAIQLIELPAAMRGWQPRVPRIRDLPERLGVVGRLFSHKGHRQSETNFLSVG